MMSGGDARNGYRGGGPEINPDETPRTTPPHWASPPTQKAISALKASMGFIAKQIKRCKVACGEDKLCVAACE
jgi:hypothetical protein